MVSHLSTKDSSVSQVIEVNLRIPQVKDPIKDASGWPISNAAIRFTLRIEVPHVPKVGELIHLATTTGSFDGSVTQTEWSDEKDLFVVHCNTRSGRSRKRRIPRVDARSGVDKKAPVVVIKAHSSLSLETGVERRVTSVSRAGSALSTSFLPAARAPLVGCRGREAARSSLFRTNTARRLSWRGHTLGSQDT